MGLGRPYSQEHFEVSLWWKGLAKLLCQLYHGHTLQKEGALVAEFANLNITPIMPQEGRLEEAGPGCRKEEGKLVRGQGLLHAKNRTVTQKHSVSK